MKRYSFFPFVMVVILICVLMIIPGYAASFSYDPITGREYDPFGGFFDLYGQYVDPRGGVLDQFGEYVKESYSSACDSYHDSQGNVYGSGIRAGQLRDGSWFFGNIDRKRYEWPSSIYFTRNAECKLEGWYYNPMGIPITITIDEKRRFVGTTVDQIASNLEEMADPVTTEKIFKDGGYVEMATLMLQEGIVDDEGYLNFILGRMTNPDPSQCLVWNVGFSGYSFDNGKRFRATYWNCYPCEGEEQQIHCTLFETDPFGTNNEIESWPWPSFADEDIDGDWLGDGQDVIEPEPIVTEGLPQGTNPFANYQPEMPF